ncbi:MAG: carbohydrate transporter permease [Paenibacillaceae bacterium]|nr:carbohydrate transporter permease [Paenibacillaceae bacterium]
MARQKNAEDWLVDAAAYGGMALFALTTLLPFVNIIAKTFSEHHAVMAGKVGLWPVGFQLETFQYVVSSKEFLNAMYISILITVIGTALAVIMTTLTAYPLSKQEVPGIRWAILLFVFTMFFSGGMIPNYLLLKELGMLNHLHAVYLPGMISVFNMLIVKTHFENVPVGLEESAKLDGAGYVRILFSILLPLSLPVIATITLFNAVGLWNDYFGPMLYLNSSKLKAMPVYLKDVVLSASDPLLQQESNIDLPPEGVKAATVLAATVPILLVYPYLQKHFVKGVMIGSVKG